MRTPAVHAALAAVVLLSTAGCAQQLSTTESCGEVRAIVTSFPDDTDDQDVSQETYAEFADQFHDLVGEASEAVSEISNSSRTSWRAA